MCAFIITTFWSEVYSTARQADVARGNQQKRLPVGDQNIRTLFALRLQQLSTFKLAFPCLVAVCRLNIVLNLMIAWLLLYCMPCMHASVVD